ncbi:hypothetical protein [Fluviispira multicolorata]|uniref:Uncharacterized protein n=1 Tax=Fluviispira multicolorata TaxID=2654512 RepID=A0A833JCH2_9BACT|nr:hypothetical protein [Fluviispira multicolorata]KAB8029815.1 hypothetical protein GCL57_09760 [Fluviispira multicolorata]
MRNMNSFKIQLFISFLLQFFFAYSLLANECPKDFIENRKPAIPFVPFPMKDPDTGKALFPEDRIVVQDRAGRNYEVKAIDFFNDVNSMEYSLTQWGYSLRDPDGKYNLSTLDVCAKLLDKQKDIIEKELNKDPFNKIPSYDEWVKNIETALDAYKVAIPSLEDLAKYGNNIKFDDFITTVKAFDVPRPVLKKAELKNLNKEKNWSFEKGQKSKFYIGGKAGYKIAASKVEVRTEANAGLDAAVLGVWEGNVANADAKANSPATQKGFLDVNASVFGKTLFVYKEELSSSGYKDEKMLFNTPVQLERSVRFMVGPIPVRLAAGIRGNNFMRWGIELVPLQVQTYLQHYAGIDAYASAAVDIFVAGAGVTGRLLLVALDTRVTAGAFVEFNDAPELKLELIGTTELNALSGDLRIYVYAYVPTWKFWKAFFERKEWSTSLWSFAGYVQKGNIFDYSATLTPTGFRAKGDLSVSDVAEELEIDNKLQRENKILSLENKTQEKLNETFNAIVNDLKSENNLKLFKDVVIYSETEKSMDKVIADYLNELAKWSGPII